MHKNNNMMLIFNRKKRGNYQQKKKSHQLYDSHIVSDSPKCGRRESNPYASRHQILSLACLPISTRPRNRCGLSGCKGLQMYDILLNLQIIRNRFLYGG